MENVLVITPVVIPHINGRPDKYTCYCHECTMQRIEERLEAEQRVEEFIEEHPVIEWIPTIGITFMLICFLISMYNSISRCLK